MVLQVVYWVVMHMHDGARCADSGSEKDAERGQKQRNDGFFKIAKALCKDGDNKIGHTIPRAGSW